MLGVGNRSSNSSGAEIWNWIPSSTGSNRPNNHTLRPAARPARKPSLLALGHSSTPNKPGTNCMVATNARKPNSDRVCLFCMTT